MNDPVKQAAVLRLYPNEAQAAQMRQWIGAARALWNHLLGTQKELYEAEKRFLNPREMDQERQRWEADDGCEWRRAAISQTRQRVVKELNAAIADFFASRSGGRRGKRLGFPRFKKKITGGTLYIANTRFKIDGERSRVKLSKLGEMRVRGGRMPSGRILSARVRHRAGRWFIAVQFEAPPPRVYGRPSETVLGVDVGLKASVVRSDGVAATAPQFYRKAEKKLRRLQRRLSASQIDSRRASRKRQAIARLHERVTNCRRDFIHTRTSRIVGKAAMIGIETLDVRAMAQTRLAKSIHDAGMGQLHRQIEYKAAWAGRKVVKAGRFEPTTKTCSDCERYPRYAPAQAHHALRVRA